ncbi:MAG: glutamate-5-semialdehyde dehydrogenase [Lentisphaerae bacterium]|nr:glutamate-5-semialdehyde dehydrogenase [Lentisphaerota bacterium]
MQNNGIETISQQLEAMGEKALRAARELALLSSDEKIKVLNSMAEAVVQAIPEVLAANAEDMANARKNNLSSAMQDRLLLDEKRIIAMADGLREVAQQSDPAGRVLAEFTRPNGIKIAKVAVPLGVIGIIYEARPNVTVDAAGICLKAGNAVILRGGKEAFNSNLALAHALDRGGQAAGLIAGAVQIVPWTDREAVQVMLKMDKYLSVIIPRGGESLIRAVVAGATMPVIKHYKGVCHAYLDKSCNIEMASAILLNGKCQRPGVCNALETVLIDRAAAEKLVPIVYGVLSSAGVTVFGDEEFRRYAPDAEVLPEENLFNEYLDLRISAKVVDGVDGAVDHINFYGSHHSETILADDAEAVEKFLNGVDSAVVYSNASTRFTDGGEFGMGAEIGISTDKLHARGPMGVDELVTYKYIVRGNGQVR